MIESFPEGEIMDEYRIDTEKLEVPIICGGKVRD